MFLAVALLCLASLLMGRGRLLPSVMTTLNALPILVGYAQLDTSFGTDVWVGYALGLGFLVLCYHLVYRPATITKWNSAAETSSPDRITLLFSVIVILLVCYHFAVGGIPILSSNVEVSRFGFANSGLLGIPGRMYLFGLPFLVIYVSITRDKSTLQKVVWLVYIVSRLLAGFKGAIIEVLVFYIFVRALTGRPLRLPELFSGRNLAVGLAGVGWALVLAFRYDSLHLTSTAAAMDYLFTRLSGGSALPGYHAMTVLAPVPHQGWYVTDDILYFLRKYAHLGWSNGDVYPLDQIVSSQLYGVPLGNEAFIVPVTVGGYAGFFADCGPVVSVLLMGLVGAFYAWASRLGSRRGSSFTAASWGLCAWSAQLFILNGGLAYTAINTAVVLLFLLGVRTTCRLLVSGSAHATPKFAGPLQL